MIIQLFLLFSFLPIALCSLPHHTYEGYQLIRVSAGSKQKMAALEQFSKFWDSKFVQIWAYQPNLEGSIDLFVGPNKIGEIHNYLKTNTIPYEIIDENFGIIMREHSANISLAPEEIRRESDFNLDKFHPFDSIVAFLKILAENHPDFVKFGSLGKTFEGREQPVITLGYKNDSVQKPAMLIDAGIHAREWIAPATALHFINAFINDDDLHALLHEIDVHIVPVTNPDGYVYSWTKNRLWRKTRSGPKKVDQELCTNEEIAEYEDDNHDCFGTDGNRNFPIQWGTRGSNACPCGETYRGEGALSVPETRNLAEFIRSHNNTLKAWWILHTFSAWIAYDNRSSRKNVQELNRVAHAMTDAMAKAGAGRYNVNEVEYLCPGCSLDFGRSQDIKFVYLMELTNGYYKNKYYGFVFPEDAVNEVANSILPALRVLAEEVRKSDD